MARPADGAELIALTARSVSLAPEGRTSLSSRTLSRVALLDELEKRRPLGVRPPHAVAQSRPPGVLGPAFPLAGEPGDVFEVEDLGRTQRWMASRR